MKRILKYVLIGLALMGVGFVGLVYFHPGVKAILYPNYVKFRSPVYRKAPEERTVYDWIVIGAKEEVIDRVRYDATYQPLDYPNGDVNPGIGACTDVVIRALRRGGYDLQQLIHEDMTRHFELYPSRWGLSEPDPNIDHRRVPNQMVFMERFGVRLPIEFNEETKDSWQAGDIVYWKMPTGRDHTGVISDRRNRKGVPYVIHNSFVTMEDDVLLNWEVVGHYRFPAEP